MARFEYMVCLAQMMRITFVNGRWQGELSPNEAQALETCPDMWEFLQRVGNSGWELVSVTSDRMLEEKTILTTLYFKRERP
jgi:hypothetical protein